MSGRLPTNATGTGRLVGPWRTAQMRDRATARLRRAGRPVRHFSSGLHEFWAEIMDEAPRRLAAIHPREEWGARPPRFAPVHVDWPTGGALWVHWSAGPPPATDAASEARAIRAIQHYHQAVHGWSDIGYGYLIGAGGRVWEGRGFGVRAAHCPGHNDEPSVCLLWGDGGSLPPQVALSAVLRLAHYLGAHTLRGHREGFPTACPGDAIHAWIARHRGV